MAEANVDEQIELVFREQADGRKVARLPSGKIALIHYHNLDDVESGETWLVNLEHRDTYAVAHPLYKVRDAVQPGSATHPAVTSSHLEPPVDDELPFQRNAAPRWTQADPEALEADPATLAEPHAEAEPATKETAAEPPVKLRVPIPTASSPAESIKETDRVAFFVDAANMDSACRDAGYFMDYRKAVRHFLGGGVFYAAYYYVADFTVDRDSKQVSFLDYLNYAGYVVRLKRVKRIVDRDTGLEVFKANVDTEIVVDMLNTADNYDVAYLFSGDSDFERLVDILRSRGKRVYVVSSRNTLSRELSYVADKPVSFLEEHREKLIREQ